MWGLAYGVQRVHRAYGVYAVGVSELQRVYG